MPEGNAANISPIISVVVHVITCGTLIIVLAMLKGFITTGLSLAVSEFMLRCRDQEQLEKVARWFCNGDQILKRVEEMKATIEKEKGKK